MSGPSLRFKSENSGLATALSTRRFSDGRSSSLRNLSKTPIRPPDFNTRTASRTPCSGCGMTARIRCNNTASNDAAGNASCLASMMCVVTVRCWLAARRSSRCSIAGVTSTAVTSTFEGRCGKSNPVPAPAINRRSPGASRRRSIERRRAASNPAALATAS